MRWRLIALVILLVVPSSTLAQEPSLDSIFPPADAIGDDWQLLAAVDHDIAQWPALRRFSTAAYVGPSGARAQIELVRVNEDGGDRLAAWTVENRKFDAYRLRFSALSNDAIAPPECVKGRHASGTDAMFPDIPVGLVLCAADPDIVALVYVSGPVGSRTGAEAADHILALVLRHRMTPLSLAP